MGDSRCAASTRARSAPRPIEDRGDGGEWSSHPEIVQLREDATAEIQLVLRPHAHTAVVAWSLPTATRCLASGWKPSRSLLLDCLRRPVGATLRQRSAGRFAISLPRSIDTIHLSVMAPGHPLTQIVTRLGDMGDVVLGIGGGIARPRPARQSRRSPRGPTRRNRFPHSSARTASSSPWPCSRAGQPSTANLETGRHRGDRPPRRSRPLRGLLDFARRMDVPLGDGAGCSSGELEAHGTLRLRRSAPSTRRTAGERRPPATPHHAERPCGEPPTPPSALRPRPSCGRGGGGPPAPWP